MIAAILLNGQYKTQDLQYSLLRLKQAGCASVIIAPELKAYYSQENYSAEPDMVIGDIDPEKFDLLIISGQNAKFDQETIKLIQEFNKYNHLIAFMGNSTNFLKQTNISPDLQKNIISSTPNQDLPKFISTVLESLQKKK